MLVVEGDEQGTNVQTHNIKLLQCHMPGPEHDIMRLGLVSVERHSLGLHIRLFG